MPAWTLARSAIPRLSSWRASLGRGGAGAAWCLGRHELRGIRRNADFSGPETDVPGLKGTELRRGLLRVAAFSRQWKAGQLEWVKSSSKSTGMSLKDWCPPR